MIDPISINYSSTNSLFAIGVVMLTVLVSALYPALRASKSANPGLQRAWKLPPADGDDLKMVFPFTVSAYDITGIVSFLGEHFRRHDDAGLGGFAASDVAVRRDERGSLQLASTVALAPFDLGVTQRLTLTAVGSEIPGVDEVAVHAERLSGASGDWHRANRVFVKDLRRQFLLVAHAQPRRDRGLPHADAQHARRSVHQRRGEQRSWLSAKAPASTKNSKSFRSLMEPPDTFEDGFSWAALFGAIFVALLMVPGSIYMTLLAGVAVGPAAQWVTLILFIEVARRANKSLKRAEIFTLFYLSGAIMVTAAQLQGQFHGGLGALWAQFYVQSDSARAAGIAEHVPTWVAPRVDEDGNDILATRSLLALGVAPRPRAHRLHDAHRPDRQHDPRLRAVPPHLRYREAAVPHGSGPGPGRHGPVRGAGRRVGPQGQQAR